MLLLVSFTAKLAFFFLLRFENVFPYSFHFKANRKSIGSKTVLGIFKIALRFRDRHIFMWQSVKVSNVFNTSKFETNFLENENLFQKTEARFFR